MAKYGDLIKQAKTGKPDDQIPVKPDDQIPGKPDEAMKNLCVKVPESWRRHWAAEAKRKGKTMTQVMIEALTQEFGLPDNQQTR